MNEMEKNNGGPIMWIARDKSGNLFLYDVYPIKKENWYISQPYHYSIAWDKDLFPEVTFENSPKKIELKLVEE